MKDGDRKLWTEQIQDYRNSGLTAVECTEERKRNKILKQNLKKQEQHLKP